MPCGLLLKTEVSEVCVGRRRTFSDDGATPKSVLSTQLNYAWAHWYEVDMTQYVHNLNPVDTAAI